MNIFDLFKRVFCNKKTEIDDVFARHRMDIDAGGIRIVSLILKEESNHAMLPTATKAATDGRVL